METPTIMVSIEISRSKNRTKAKIELGPEVGDPAFLGGWGQICRKMGAIFEASICTSIGVGRCDSDL